MRIPTKTKTLMLVLLLAGAGCVKRQTHQNSPTTLDPALLDTARAVVGAPDRAADDRALDAGRHPDQLLAFVGVRPGMRVAEIGSGFGYTTELLARAVAPTGVVYGQNSRFILDRFAEKPWSERLKKPAMKNVVRVDRDFDDPLPAEARNLDAVVNVLLYHDTVWMKTDRARMNRAIYTALKPGGVYVIVDHSGRAGTGTTETESLHRIEEGAVRQEIEAAGFRLVATADFLRNPADPRDWNASPRKAGEKRGTSDRFVLKFAKPV
jgi:predicted methyltransferase